MRKILLTAFLISISTIVPALADAWSIGVGTGPFVFGYFAERSTRIVTDSGSTTTRTRLSAATRPGGAADIERSFNGWLAVRLDAAWTRAPMKIKSGDGSGISFDAGHANITTVTLPLVVTLNRHGAFRFHLAAGPAYAFYTMKGRTGGGGTLPLFDGTRGRLGGTAGGGVAWWLSDRFAVEGAASDTVTPSPFRRADFGSSTFGGLKIPETHNVHSTVGIRYRF
jgi:hypothetical protein